MKEKLIINIKNDIEKLITIYYKEKDICKKTKIITSILKLKEIIKLVSNENYKLDIEKSKNYYKCLLFDNINSIREKKQIYKTYNNNIFLEFYNNNYKLLKNYISDHEYFSIINSDQIDNNILNSILNNFNLKYRDFVNEFIKDVYIIDNLYDISIDGFTNNVEQLHKSYCVSIPSIYIIYHELTHLYQEHISNYNSLLVNNLFVEIFPYSIELIIGKLLNSNYKDLVLYNLYNLCNDMIKFYKKLSINDIKSFIGSICGIKLCELYFYDKNKYFEYLNFYSANFNLFKSFEDLEMIGINKEDLISQKLIKNLIKN